MRVNLNSKFFGGLSGKKISGKTISRKVAEY